MNIRSLTFTLFAAALLTQACPSLAMEESMKRVGEHAAQKLLEAGTKVVEKLPKSINVQVRPADLFWPTLSVAGAISIYNGISQGLSTLWKTPEELAHKRQSREYGYYHAASKVLVGLISLAGSYAVFCSR